jgi:AcrR family transcriptional regulator
VKETRQYRQAARADAASRNTERILGAALELFIERPYDQITLAAVAQRAGVGLQTLIRRVGTKDGLAEAVGAWIAPQVAEDLGTPPGPDPARVAAAFRRHYQRWAAVLDRNLTQQDSSPALAANAEGGRRAHREWIEEAFAEPLAALAEPVRSTLRARLVAVTGVELWLVLTAHEGLTAGQAEDTIAMLVRAALAAPDADRKQEP